MNKSYIVRIGRGGSIKKVPVVTTGGKAVPDEECIRVLDGKSGEDIDLVDIGNNCLLAGFSRGMESESSDRRGLRKNVYANKLLKKCTQIGYDVYGNTVVGRNLGNGIIGGMDSKEADKLLQLIRNILL